MYGFRQDGLRLGDFAPSSIPHRDIQLPLGASEFLGKGSSEFLLEAGTDFGVVLSGCDDVLSFCNLVGLLITDDGPEEREAGPD